jgi:hypothetical protein
VSINERDDERERQAETEAPLAADSGIDDLDDDSVDNKYEADEEQNPEPAAVGAPASMQSWGRIHGPSRRTEAREARRHRFEARRARKRLFYGLAGGAVALALIAGLFLPSLAGLGGGNNPGSTTNTTSTSAAASVGTKFVAQNSAIVALEEAHEPYSTSPPTSGARYALSVAWGVYDQQIPDEAMVRNLEEGGVVIHHNLTDESASADLQAFVESQHGYPGCFLMQPNASVAEGTVTLTAWEWLETYPGGVDKVGMQAFIVDHRNDAPLFLSNTCGATTELPLADAPAAGPDTSHSG